MLPLAALSRIAVVGPLADDVLTDWCAGTLPYKSTIAGAIAERFPGAAVEVASGTDTVALRAASSGRYVTASADGATVVAEADAAVDAALFDVTDWGDGVLTLRSHASGLLLTGGHWPVRADAERVGGWVAQESFRRVTHADGTWSLLHLGSGRWLRVMREAGLVSADAVTLDAAERFTARVVRAGAESVATAAAEVYRTAREANPRTVLTVASSFPYVLGEGVADAPTVVWSSHGGQGLGRGLVDALTGDVEPTGRLAQSWPAHPDQAGDLFDYDTLRQQATYRHQPAPMAFAFGHGCTYGEVTYAGVSLSVVEVAAPAPTHRHPALTPRADEAAVTVIVTVRNDGARAAEELVQVYAVGDGATRIPTPLRLLLAYRRVRLEPGETREVELTFAVERLAVWDDKPRLEGTPSDWLHEGALRVQQATYRIAAGSSADACDVEAALTVS